VITASAARSALRRKARADEIRRQVDAALRQAAREERAPDELAEPVEITRPCRPALDASLLVLLVAVFVMMAAALPTVLRTVPGRRNRQGRRAARARLGCYAAYAADGSPPAHDPESCDASCHADTTEVPRSKVPYGGRRSRRWRDGPSLRLSQRIWRLTEARQCRCATCVARAEIEAMRELVPGEVPHTPETWALHQADTRRLLALWHVVVYGPEAAAELARLRPDDRPADSAWARLRLALEALGVLRSRDHGPPGVGGVVVLCHPRTGPPVARRASEAPVICP
jgi:hypothetical protein